MGWLAQIAGTGLILLALTDIYMTVLYPRGGKGVVSVPLSRGIWYIFRLTARAMPKSRDRLFSYMGSSLMVATVAIWVSLLMVGFALIFWPALGSEIRTDKGPTSTDFMTAFYVSGYSLTTLGTGDITPQTAFYRLLMILEAALGFSVLTMTLTYFESVYSQLIQRNTFALSLHHRTAKTADAAELLARMGASGDFDGSARQDIAQMAQSLLNLLESHHSYPTLGYFRWQETYYAIARTTFVLMDTVTLIKSAIDEESYRSFLHSSAVAELGDGGMHFLTGLTNSFLPSGYVNRNEKAEYIWRDRYYRAIKRLQAEGIKTRLDKEEGADIYVCWRRKWNPYVVALAKYMEYDWSAIAPVDGDYSI